MIIARVPVRRARAGVEPRNRICHGIDVPGGVNLADGPGTAVGTGGDALVGRRGRGELLDSGTGISIGTAIAGVGGVLVAGIRHWPAWR